MKNLLENAVYQSNPSVLEKAEKDWPENMDYIHTKAMSTAFGIMNIRKEIAEIKGNNNYE